MSMERYRIESLVARGEMGEVHRAFDNRLQRVVALKVVRRDRVADIGPDRLLREARAAAALRHPNIVVVYDVGADDDGAYIAMELVDGEPLRAFVGAGELARKLGWLREIALALAAAHAAGLVHRDVKPDNVLVTRAGVAKVLDFGIAKHVFARDDTTQSMSAAGTPAYVAPEQRVGGPATPASDQYAWAVVAVELVTGERIFDPARAERALTRAGVPARVVGAIARGLAESPAERWPSMAVIAAELAAAGVESQPTADVEAAPETQPTRGALPSHTRARPTPYIAVAGVAAVIAGGSIAWLVLHRSPPAAASCRVAAVLAVHDLPPSQQPLEIAVCEGQVLATSNTDQLPLAAIAPFAGPLDMEPDQALGIDARFALPLCIDNGIAAFAQWGGAPRGRLRTTTTILPRNHKMVNGASTTSTEFAAPAPCAFAVHPSAAPIFTVCEHPSPTDPRLLLRFVDPVKRESETRDPDDRAKPRAVVAVYPFDDRPLVVYRAGDRLISMFPSMIGVANEGRIELARGTLGDPAATAVGEHAVVVWPEDRGGMVLRAAMVAARQQPQPLDIGDPPASAVSPAVARLGDGFVLAWIGDGGVLEVGAGGDLATAVTRARPIAGAASRVRIATNGDKIAVAWRDLAGGGHVARLACELP